MVSSIIPGTAGANALGVDQRYARPGQTAAQQQRDEAVRQGDRVEVSAASLSAVRESVRAALSDVHQTLALGHEAQTMLVQAQALARSGDADAQAELDAVLAQFASRVDAVVGQGVRLAAGATMSVQAEVGAASIEVSGVDLRLKDDPAANDVIQVRQGANVSDPNLARDAQASLDQLQKAMERLLDSARSLEAHQGFLSAAESAAMGVRTDLDADGARLLALQAKQGLEKIGAASIANVEPQAVLHLFRA